MSKIDELVNWQEKNGFVKAQNKIKIYYTTSAFAKTVQLVKAHPVEIGWNMFIMPFKDGYEVSDIVVYPQKVSAAHISVDVGNWGLWKASLPDAYDANLFGHGHSHVNMGVFASIVDENQQYEEVMHKGKGFYFFQIWNKRNEIKSFFYDIDNKIYYTDENIEMIVQWADNFVYESFNMVSGERILEQYEEGEDFESEQIF